MFWCLTRCGCHGSGMDGYWVCGHWVSFALLIYLETNQILTNLYRLLKSRGSFATSIIFLFSTDLKAWQIVLVIKITWQESVFSSWGIFIIFGFKRLLCFMPPEIYTSCLCGPTEPFKWHLWKYVFLEIGISSNLRLQCHLVTTYLDNTGPADFLSLSILKFCDSWFTRWMETVTRNWCLVILVLVLWIHCWKISLKQPGDLISLRSAHMFAVVSAGHLIGSNK